MPNALAVDCNESVQGEIMPIYTVVIHKNENGIGYWAVCDMPNGGATTMGDTIHETQRNMYESMSLFLKNDYPTVKDFSLNFVIDR
jgi:predicted RNase H-like HicB family nuclease